MGNSQSEAEELFQPPLISVNQLVPPITGKIGSFFSFFQHLIKIKSGKVFTPQIL